MRSIEGTLILWRPFSLSALRPLLFLPANSLPGKACEVVPIDPNELEAALAADGLESP